MDILKAFLKLPVVQPIIALLKSPTFVAGLLMLIADVVVTQVPELEPYRAELIVVISAIGAAVIGSRFYEQIKAGEFDGADDLAPILGPLVELLKSRKFALGVAAVIADVAIAYVPQLEAQRGELMVIVPVLVGLLIAKIAYVDGKAKAESPKG